MAPSEHFHTIEEWDAIRPIFTRLYQEERKKLDDVRKILEYRFNFTTTVKQCKTKIKEWNLGKYKKQRELLHAKRLFNEGRRRGKHVEIRLRGDPVTLDDIAKHFKRKATELDDLDSMIPTSPTPQELIWTSRSRSNSPEAEEINPFHLPDSALQNLDYPPSGFSPHDRARFISQAVVRASVHNSLGNGPGDGHGCSHGEPCAVIPRGMIMGSTERGFFNLRDLVEADFGNISIRNTYPDWWKHLDRIVVDFDDAQFHHVAGRQELAVRSYDRVLEAVTRYTTLPSMALLQFVSYLLSWAAIPVSGDVVKVLFSFLEGLKNEKHTHPALAAILPCLLTSPEHASCSIALFQECISNYLTQQLGKNSITVLRMNLRLCRHLFAMDDQEPAWSTLRDISNLRASCKDETLSIIEPELDQELMMTLQLFDERTRDKANLEAHMRPCTDFFADNQSDGRGDSQCHSLCNFKLGLYAIAHKQAKATVICFRKAFPDHDPRVQDAKCLLNRIEHIKAEIKNAGVVWPLDTELFAQNDWTVDSYCKSPSGFRPAPLHRRSSGSITSITSFDSPLAPIDDFNDTLYPTFTNQSDVTSVASYPQPNHLHSTSSVSNYPLYSGLQINSPVPLAERFPDMD